MKPIYNHRVLLLLLHIVINLSEGSADYIELRNSPHFIDKSELIRHFFKDDWHSYLFITCPRGFGKTANLHMLQLFASIELDENRVPKDPYNTTSYELFRKLHIARYQPTMQEHLARYVVLTLDLKADRLFPEYTVETAIHFLTHKLRQSFEPYQWLLEIPKENLIGKEEYNGYAIDDNDIAFLSNLTQHAAFNETEMTASLHRLASILMVYFQSNVIVLVDNYDSVLSHAFRLTKQCAIDFYGIIGETIRQAFKQPVVSYGMATAVSGLILPKVRRTINRAIHYRFLGDHSFYDYFAFTEQDVTELISRYELPTSKVHEINYVYGGYKDLDYKNIYHIESVIKFLQNVTTDQSLRSYWRLSTEDNFVKWILKDTVLRQIIDNVINKLSSKFTYVDCYEDLDDLEEFFKEAPSFLFSKWHQDVSLSYIFDHGYLSRSRMQEEFFAPNSQMRYALKKILSTFVVGTQY